MLHHRRTGAIHEVLEQVERGVDIREVDLTRMLSELDQHRFVEGGHKPAFGIDEAALAQDQIAVYQFVEGRLLTGVLTVAQTSLDRLPVLLDFPRSLAVHEPLLTERDGHLIWKMIGNDGLVGLSQICHGSP